MKKVSSAFYISAIYFTLSFFWILFSDKAILLFTQEHELLTFFQTIKGWFFISATSLFLYFFITKEFKKEEDLKEYFKKSIDNLASPIIIFNENGEVLTVNKTFEKLSGYKYKEIDTIDKWTKKAYDKNASNQKNIIDNLYTIDTIIDNGISYIKTKSGKTIIWNFYSAPFGIRNKKRTIIANAVDITEVKEKEKMIMQQSKMAAMGEVLENIAHQWRQPLSNISTISTTINLKYEMNTLDNKEINDSMKIINDTVQYLSKTIDDFRNFFKPSNEKTYFNIQDTFEKTLLVIGNKFKNENIEFINKIDNIKILNDNNALMQVFINLFNNSKDAFIERNITNRLLFLKTNIKNDEIILEIKDNAGGIEKNIIDKIFEPYFTTKSNSFGTGIGLYMCQEIVTKHMNGKISVENVNYTYNEKKEKGTNFIITLPLKTK
ncbi:ATP-binding protein [Arcobacter sp.]|uniref:PAS domain-containing sensor histidine kinase n=1 Tax=Arcobacter sp. TaxID=1872629 RepID=UPI003C7877E8